METMNDPQSHSTQPRISPVKTAIKWGLIAGAAMIILSMITYYAGMTQNTTLQWLSYLLLALGVFLGTREHRDRDLGGFISYGRGLGTGVLVSLFSGLLLTVFILLFYGVIDTGALDELKRVQEDAMYERGMSDEQIEMSMKFVTPGMMALFTLPTMTFFGLIISLVVAAILKRNRPPFYDEQE